MSSTQTGKSKINSVDLTTEPDTEDEDIDLEDEDIEQEEEEEKEEDFDIDDEWVTNPTIDIEQEPDSPWHKRKEINYDATPLNESKINLTFKLKNPFTALHIIKQNYNNYTNCHYIFDESSKKLLFQTNLVYPEVWEEILKFKKYNNSNWDAKYAVTKDGVIFVIGDLYKYDVYQYPQMNFDIKPNEIDTNLSCSQPSIILDKAENLHLIGHNIHYMYNKNKKLIKSIETKNEFGSLDILSVHQLTTALTNELIVLCNTNKGGKIFKLDVNEGEKWEELDIDLREKTINYEMNWCSQSILTQNNELIIFGGGENMDNIDQSSAGEYFGQYHREILIVDLMTKNIRKSVIKLPRKIPGSKLCLETVSEEVKKLIFIGYINEQSKAMSKNIPMAIAYLMKKYYINETVYLYHPCGQYSISTDELLK